MNECSHPAILKTFLLLGNTPDIEGSVEYSPPHLVIPNRLLTFQIRNKKLKHFKENRFH
jgi:hypothetical protein